MEKIFDLEIVTPLKTLFKHKVKHVRMPGVEGYFGILANHEPFITSLKTGEIKIELDNAQTKYFATSGGIVEVLPSITTVLVQTAEEAAEIEVERAIYAKERAARRLTTPTPDVNIERAKLALEKAINRIKVSKKLE